jgi:hypothetical protein
MELCLESFMYDRMLQNACNYTMDTVYIIYFELEQEQFTFKFAVYSTTFPRSPRHS